ncbi:MAG: M48 family metallopeptidase, partial [Chloroflexi bacterium]|nr:M48 family metallopeptidase [Chloroflexota bacterium]
MSIDTERQQKAKEYARLNHRLLALDLGLSAVALVLVLASGLSVWLRDAVLAVVPFVFLGAPLYFIIGVIGFGILFAPLTYYGGFVLPHRYGLATQSLGKWILDLFKGGVLSIALGGILIQIIYFLLLAAPEWWWLVAAGVMLIFSVLLANLAPILIFPLFFKFTPLEDQELVQRLVRLTERANTRMNGVYTVVLSDKSTAANAAFMGLGNTKRIVLGDTLYQNFTPDEIETILAHELGHQVHNDIVGGIVVQTALTLAGFYVADVVLRAGVAYFGFTGIADLAAMPLFAIAIGVFGLATMPLGNWYSRWREVRADQYALETTRNPQAFIRAFEKLA